MKYAIVVDSASSLTKDEAEKLGWYFLPLHITINNIEYEDGVQITSKNLFEKFTLDKEVKTSSVNLGEAENLFIELSKEYDKIFVYPISKHLSGCCQSLTILAEQFPKVRVIQSVEIVELILLDLFWLENQIKKDETKIDEYIKFIENGGWRKSVTLIPKYNKYLVKGGRLHPAAALVAKLLNIVPLIAFEDGQLLKEGVGRIFKKSILKNIEKKKEFLKANETNEFLVAYLHSNATEDDQRDIQNKFEEVFGEKVIKRFISPVVSIHTGPESYVGIVMEIDKETKNKFLDYIKEKQ
ncbi:DegV family protein [Mycoplasmopsis columbinasalis]|uniref:Fatty acid-binding protein DegV-like protein n=1 Tax=Mycoplasmopsis columbinasalis TaxID=114880 RepID=A0A449BAD0_9BACT|nr:DegV family protein [Mycoplasmopsis columbinasalis]VEU78119.1 Fatty acid-binding protein DegV-like protein [Mycoplasmopsis columbinasalis]